MKLKKFAALALAGVMAVSMLAGCSGKSTNTTPSNPGADDGETEVVPSSAVVTMFNNGQSVTNKATVKFTDDAKFEANMKNAVELYGIAVDGDGDRRDSDKVLETYLKLTGETFDTEAYWGSGASTWSNSFYTKDTKGLVDEVKKDNDVDFIVVLGINDALSADVAVRSALKLLQDNVFSKLQETTLDQQKPGDEYVNFTYTGKACVVSATNADNGAPVYYVACQITQNATVEKAASV